MFCIFYDDVNNEFSVWACDENDCTPIECFVFIPFKDATVALMKSLEAEYDVVYSEVPYDKLPD